MRIILIHKADEKSEAGIPPTPELIVNMGKLMEEMGRSGVLLAAEGLQPSSKSVRLTFSEGKPALACGPFTGSDHFIAGFAIVQIESMERAIEWASRLAGVVDEVDIGLVKEPWDLGLCPKPEGQMTRFMMMYKANKVPENDSSSSSEGIRKWTQDMLEAGVLLLAESLQPSSKSARLKFKEGKISVSDGPFTESKEFVGGFCMLQVRSKEEAIEWGSRFVKVLRDAKVEGDLELDICPLSEVSGLL
jgi:hypothetical protein